MILRPSVLCPIDFSGGSRGALRYAAVIAAHLGARLTVLAIDDPLLIEAAEFADSPAIVPGDTIEEMRKFCAATFAGQQLTGPMSSWKSAPASQPRRSCAWRAMVAVI